ncbi:hypothetical protein TNCV_4497831 [Trichonephila clavipes]|nr:hypothetical protein TNCV_4497831 [Trichonephila clavipes]
MALAEIGYEDDYSPQTLSGIAIACAFGPLCGLRLSFIHVSKLSFRPLLCLPDVTFPHFLYAVITTDIMHAPNKWLFPSPSNQRTSF